MKSLLDGFTAIALAATLGWGVLLTIPLILLYQGASRSVPRCSSAF